MDVYKIISIAQYALTIAIGVLLIFASIFGFVPECLGGTLIGYAVINLVPVVINIIKKENVGLMDFSAPFISAIFGIIIFFNVFDLTVLIAAIVLVVLGIGIGMIAYSFYVFFAKKKRIWGIIYLLVGVIVIPNGLIFIIANENSQGFWLALGAFVVVYNAVYLVKEIMNKDEDNDVKKLNEKSNEDLEINNETN